MDPALVDGRGYDPDLSALRHTHERCRADTIPGVNTVTYDINDERTETAYPHGLTQTATLDASGRPTRITAEADDSTVVDLAYTYALDAVDGAKIRTRTDELTGYVTSYDYDSAGRFSYAAERDGGEIVESWQYCYDPAGNLTSQGVSPGCPPRYYLHRRRLIAAPTAVWVEPWCRRLRQPGA